jgi:PadR family transcriptional regulator, regulatory protein PadR
VSIPLTNYPLMPKSAKRDLLPGLLDLLILKCVATQAMHGYAIAQYLQSATADVIQVQEGSLYPALQRMRQKGWIKAEWRTTPNNQRARYYMITTAGRKQLGEQQDGFTTLVTAVQRVLRLA